MHVIAKENRSSVLCFDCHKAASFVKCIVLVLVRSPFLHIIFNYLLAYHKACGIAEPCSCIFTIIQNM